MINFLEQLFNNNEKRLLAFSGGIDSSALFFILQEQNIEFDIAIVDYGIRDQSKEEVTYAVELANKYNKNIYLKHYDDIKFSEKLARDFRYDFFEEIIKKHSYDILITAHQLNDKLEWFLMQFTKGAGITELIGFEKIEQRKNYKLIRPILDMGKEELENYLQDRDIKYFIDDSNSDTKYKRNYFRLEYSNKLIKDFKDGILNSFEYISKDIHSLNKLSRLIYSFKSLSIYKYNLDKNIAIKVIDKELKKRGVLISSATREEILAQNEIIISSKIAISLVNGEIWIAPISRNGMKKEFKESCRIHKIPKNIRAYLSDIFESHKEMEKSLYDNDII